MHVISESIIIRPLKSLGGLHAWMDHLLSFTAKKIARTMEQLEARNTTAVVVAREHHAIYPLVTCTH